MNFEIQIVEKLYNNLIKRKEYKIKVMHKTSGTPNRVEIRKKIAALESVDENLVFIKKVKTLFGTRHSYAIVNIYDNEEIANKFEPLYIKLRNLPKDEREKLIKEIKEKKRKKKSKTIPT